MKRRQNILIKDIVNGEITSGGVVLIQKGDEYFLNNKLVQIDRIREAAETLIILPAKNDD